MIGLGGADPVAELATQVAAAARAVPGVADLTGGPFGTVATYVAGGRVLGVTLSPERAEVSFIGLLGHDLAAVAGQVRAAAADLTGLPVDVTVADVALNPPAADSPGPRPTEGTGT